MRRRRESRRTKERCDGPTKEGTQIFALCKIGWPPKDVHHNRDFRVGGGGWGVGLGLGYPTESGTVL